MKINKTGPAGLYIHIPFCLKKCGYCDFLSFAGYGEEFMRQYTEALLQEIRLYREEERSLDTVFFGGGTPSLFRGERIARILEAVRAAFCVCEDAEISLEANPGTLDIERLGAFREAGVNRLSIGLQSMDDGLLKFLSRVHDCSDFLENFQSARAAGFENINADLMLGLPGQSPKMWQETLEQLIMLSPEHISFYSLQLEEGTPFARTYRAGKLDLPPEQEERRMYHEGIRVLKEAGYGHYEISNSAKPGYECRHNLKYWSFDEYIGVGLGAHSFTYTSGRRCNVSNFESYFAMLQRGRLPVDARAYKKESPEDLMGEYVFTALRKASGLDTEDFFSTFGRDFYTVYADRMDALSRYREQGLVTVEGPRLALTEIGIDDSNRIMAEFV